MFYKLKSKIKIKKEIIALFALLLITLASTIYYNYTKNKIHQRYEKVIETNPNDIGALNDLGAIFLELGEYQKAKDCYEKVIEIDSNHIDALNNLGVIFIELGEYQKAKDCYENAIKINPNYADAYNNLGIIFYNSGDNM